MASSTPRGLPIIDPATDPIKDGANALAEDINSLARAADTQITRIAEEMDEEFGDLPSLVEAVEGALPWRGTVPDGTDINDVRTPGVWEVPSQAAALTMTNLPIQTSSILTVWSSPGRAMLTQEFVASGSNGYPEKYTRITRSATTWTGAWEHDRETKGLLAPGTSLTTFRTAGKYLVVATTASTFTGMPDGLTYPAYGVLEVTGVSSSISSLSSQILDVYVSAGKYRMFHRVDVDGGTFPAWAEVGGGADVSARVDSLELDRVIRGPISTGTDLNLLMIPGFYRSSTSSALLNMPPGVSSNAAALITVKNIRTSGTTYGPWAEQWVAVYGSSSSLWWRISKSTSGAWNEWKRLDVQDTPTPTPALADAGPYRRDDLVVRARHRRGKIGTGKAAVALRFDHHLDPFMANILPLLKKYRLPWAQVVCPERVGSYPTDLNTTWAQLQQACIDWGGEVWNHGGDHGDATTETALYHQIVDSLTTLKTNLPTLAIEGWAPPGLADGQYMGAAPFKTTAQNTETYAGQLIMGHHALVAGYSDDLYRVLDGEPPIGASHFTAENSNPAEIAGRLDTAQKFDAGVAFMLHPNLLGTEGKLTVAEFEVVLADIAARRDAGLIEVLSYSGLWFADASSEYRQDFAPKAARGASTAVAAGATHSVAMETSIYVRGQQLGAPKEIRVEVTAATAGTATLAVNGYEATTHDVVAGANVIRRPITVPLDVGNLTVKMTPSVAVTVTGFHCQSI